MSTYLDRYKHYLGPTSDYLTLGIFDDSYAERRRAPAPRSRIVRDEPRPFYMCPCLVESRRSVETKEDDSSPTFFHTYKRPLCKPEDLLKIIRKSQDHYQLPTDSYNEVYPGIYLSDALTAMSAALLKRLRVTHVLNAAQGTGREGSGFVNTSASFYTPAGIEFLGVPAFDNPTFRIYHYFEDAADFIDAGLKSGGKVLVHCQAGISRSATLICAFLMLKRGLSVQDAVKTIRRNRAIIPNKGFLQQLCDLNDKIKGNSNYLDISY